MTPTTVGILAGLGMAAAVSSRLEGTLATGLLAGYLFGGSLGLLGFAWQRHVMRTQPERTFVAIVQGFLFKIAGVLVGALALRFVEPVAAAADWRSFAVAYAVAVFLCLVLGSFEIHRQLQRRSAGDVAADATGETAL